MARKTFNDIVFKNASENIKGFDTLDNFSEKDFPLLPYKDNNYFILKANFIYTELLLTSVYLILSSEFKKEDIGYIFSGLSHNFTNYNVSQQNIINISLIYLGNYKGKTETNRLINWYFKNNNDRVNNYKLFIIDKGIIKLSLNNYNKKRFNIYVNLLNSKDTIGLTKKSKDSTDFEEAINSIINNKKNETLTSYDLINEVLSNKLEIYIKDLIQRNEDFKYIETQLLNELIYYALKDNELIESEIIRLKEITHLCGKTGSGKTVLIDFIVFILAKHNKRILFLTSKHADGIKIKEKYTKMGFKASVIVGHDRNKYTDEFIKTKMNANNDLNIFQTIKRNESVISNLDSTCLNNYISSNAEETSSHSYNCKKCEHKITCGYHNLTREFLNSNILITTSYNLCYSSVNASFDGYNRSLIETAYAISDFIIVDEADLIQVNFDNAAIYESQIYSKNANLYNDSYISNIIRLYSTIDRTKMGSIPFLHNHKVIDTAKTDAFIDVACNNFLLNDKDEMIKELVGTKTFTTFNLISMYCNTYIKEIHDADGNIIYDYDNSKENYSIEFAQSFMNYLQDNKLKEELNFNYIDYLSTNIENNIELFNKQYNRFIKSKYMKKYTITYINNKKYNKNKAIKFYNFILFINHIDSYIKYTNIFLPTILLFIDKERHEIPSNSLLKSIYLPKSLAWILTGFSLEKWDKEGLLIYKDFSILGREILYTTRDYIASAYEIPATPVLFVSATAFEENSSLYAIKYPVDYLIKSKLQTENDNTINTFFTPVILTEGLNNSAVNISSSKNQRQFNIKKLCRILIRDFLPSLVEDARKFGKATLFSCSSYDDAYTVYEEIKCLKHKGYNIKILTNSTIQNNKKLDATEVLNISNIENLSNLDNEAVDIAIVIGAVINRGYNILKADGENSSYIHNILVLNRILPSPNNSATNVSYVNSIITRYALNKSKNDKKAFRECLKQSNETSIHLKICYSYTNLPSSIKDSIASNTLVDIRQLVGRGQRGSNNTVNLYFLDASYFPKTATAIANGEIIESLNEIKDDADSSLFLKWLDILNKNDILITELYGDIKKSFNRLKIKAIK
ncbi:hypothetical protein SAMN02745163_02516 [Clostridium cavendishii DSM 21758]|uniref:Uncharacterized protein n=1 Tax=Clostridium cavendishii DSM 21758 TaxID=1121302 RepID=A0A1M6LW94_9CLOT|nr:hypothetical protein [Clostridium cavendishii]SHJ75446.1 hypothetical protein SAMN02745163_02516 [Clostridium cavendishii DSM 21758]